MSFTGHTASILTALEAKEDANPWQNLLDQPGDEQTILSSLTDDYSWSGKSTKETKDEEPLQVSVKKGHLEKVLPMLAEHLLTRSDGLCLILLDVVDEAHEHFTQTGNTKAQDAIYDNPVEFALQTTLAICLEKSEEKIAKAQLQSFIESNQNWNDRFALPFLNFLLNVNTAYPHFFTWGDLRSAVRKIIVQSDAAVIAAAGEHLFCRGKDSADENLNYALAYVCFILADQENQLKNKNFCAAHFMELDSKAVNIVGRSYNKVSDLISHSDALTKLLQSPLFAELNLFAPQHALVADELAEIYFAAWKLTKKQEHLTQAVKFTHDVLQLNLEKPPLQSAIDRVIKLHSLLEQASTPLLDAPTPKEKSVKGLDEDDGEEKITPVVESKESPLVPPVGSSQQPPDPRMRVKQLFPVAKILEILFKGEEVETAASITPEDKAICRKAQEDDKVKTHFKKTFKEQLRKEKEAKCAESKLTLEEIIAIKNSWTAWKRIEKRAIRKKLRSDAMVEQLVALIQSEESHQDETTKFCALLNLLRLAINKDSNAINAFITLKQAFLFLNRDEIRSKLPLLLALLSDDQQLAMTNTYLDWRLAKQKWVELNMNESWLLLFFENDKLRDKLSPLKTLLLLDLYLEAIVQNSAWLKYFLSQMDGAIPNEIQEYRRRLMIETSSINNNYIMDWELSFLVIDILKNKPPFNTADFFAHLQRLICNIVTYDSSSDELDASLIIPVLIKKINILLDHPASSIKELLRYFHYIFTHARDYTTANLVKELSAKINDQRLLSAWKSFWVTIHSQSFAEPVFHFIIEATKQKKLDVNLVLSNFFRQENEFVNFAYLCSLTACYQRTTEISHPKAICHIRPEYALEVIAKDAAQSPEAVLLHFAHRVRHHNQHGEVNERYFFTAEILNAMKKLHPADKFFRVIPQAFSNDKSDIRQKHPELVNELNVIREIYFVGVSLYFIQKGVKPGETQSSNGMEIKSTPEEKSPGPLDVTKLETLSRDFADLHKMVLRWAKAPDTGKEPLEKALLSMFQGYSRRNYDTAQQKMDTLVKIRRLIEDCHLVTYFTKYKKELKAELEYINYALNIQTPQCRA